MRLLLRYSSSPALPPRTALLCNGISFCFPLSVLGWVLQGFFVCCALPWAFSILRGASGHPYRLVPWHGPAPGGWHHLAQPLCLGSVGGTRQMLLAAGMILEPVQKSLPVLSRCPAASSVMPCAAWSCHPSPLRYLYKQLSGLCF